MRKLWTHIMQHLKLKLGLAIVLIVTLIFSVSVDSLYSLFKNYIRESAVKRAAQILDNTALRIADVMGEVETATDNMAWYVDGCQDPDSLIRITREILANNPHFKAVPYRWSPTTSSAMGVISPSIPCATQTPSVRHSMAATISSISSRNGI